MTTLKIRVRGDATCDIALDINDMNGFVLALLDPIGYAAAFAGCPAANCDMDRDGGVDGRDIELFVAALLH